MSHLVPVDLVCHGYGMVFGECSTYDAPQGRIPQTSSSMILMGIVSGGVLAQAGSSSPGLGVYLTVIDPVLAWATSSSVGHTRYSAPSFQALPVNEKTEDAESLTVKSGYCCRGCQSIDRIHA